MKKLRTKRVVAGTYRVNVVTFDVVFTRTGERTERGRWRRSFEVYHNTSLDDAPWEIREDTPGNRGVHDQWWESVPTLRDAKDAIKRLVASGVKVSHL